MTLGLAWAIFYSLDAFIACCAIGWQAHTWRKRFALALMFGACDAAASMLASFWSLRTPEMVTFVVYLLGVFLFVHSVRSKPRLVYALPVVLSVDNLFGCASANVIPAVALTTTVAAMLGMTLAASVRRGLVLCEAED